MNLTGSDVQILLMYSYGVRLPSVLILRAKLNGHPISQRRACILIGVDDTVAQLM